MKLHYSIRDGGPTPCNTRRAVASTSKKAIVQCVKCRARLIESAIKSFAKSMAGIS